MKSRILTLLLLLATLAAIAALTLRREASAPPPPTYLGTLANRPNASAVDPRSIAPLPRNRGSAAEGSTLIWYDAIDLRIEGRGWSETEGPYGRLPPHAENRVPRIVWDLGQDSSGVTVRFVTDSTEIAARWDGGTGTGFLSVRAAAGLDLYAFRDGRWEFCGSAYPEPTRTTRTLAGPLKAELTKYLIYLPLRNRITRLEIGVRPESTLAPPPRARDPLRPIVVYGTSITQGLSASRPGATHLAQLSRRLDREIINLGFVSAGKMEPEVVEILIELDPAFFVLDCVPNLYDKDIAERYAHFVRRIRTVRPQTPILLVGSGQFEREIANFELSRTYLALLDEGIDRLFYLPGEGMLDYDRDATIDGAHPNDLGFRKMADKYEEAFREVLDSIGED